MNSFVFVTSLKLLRSHNAPFVFSLSMDDFQVLKILLNKAENEQFVLKLKAL